MFGRTGATTSDLTVNYTVGGTATLGTDYTGISSTGTTKTVTFVAGSATATVTVDPTADITGELNENVTLTLATGTGYSIGTTTAVVGTITNDDAIFSSAFDLVLLQDLSGSFSDDITIVSTLIPNLIIGVNSLQPNTPIGISSFVDKPVFPFGSSGDYTYRTDQPLTTDSAILQSIYNGLTILSGDDEPESQLEALLQVAVRPLEIGFRAGTKRVVVLFTDASYHVAGDGAAAGITTPNNLDAILNGTTAGTGEDYPGIVQLRQKLIAANILPIFAVTSDQSGRYKNLLQDLAVGGSVVILSNDSSNISDAIRSGLADLFFVNITAPTGGLVTDENGSTENFSIVLTIQPTADVSISLQLPDATEGRLSASSLLFTPTNWNIPQTIAVTGIDDPEGATLVDGDQTYIIVTGAAVSADLNYNGINPIDITVVNQDRDTTSITLAVAPIAVTEDGTTNLVYTFTRTGAITSALTVNYTVASTSTLGTDYTGISATGTTKNVTFVAGSATATVTVDPTADTEIEADETVALTLAAGSGYSIGTTAAVTGTITNDDFPSITLAVSPAAVTEDGTTNLVYTFTRTGATTTALAVNYTVGGTATLGPDYTGIDATPATKTVTFLAGSVTATVTVDPTADSDIEPDETVDLSLAAGTGYIIGSSAAVTSTILNEDISSLSTYTLRASESSLLLLGSKRINGIGNGLSNVLTGNSNNNRLAGLLGRDVLTGGGIADSDLFVYTSLAESLLGAGNEFDVITDFGNRDRIFVPLSVEPERIESSIGNVASLSAAAITGLLTETSFAANSVAAFSAAGQVGTFIAMNDGHDGYQAESDALVFLRGYSVSVSDFVDFA
jgi:hypothetical protein